MTQTARDFLADNGLAIRGARGKFSTEAKAFLAKAQAQGKTFSDSKGNTVHAPRIIKKAKVFAAPVARRKEKYIHIVDSFGISMNVDFCIACARSVSQCNCAEGPQASAFLSKDAHSITLV